MGGQTFISYAVKDKDVADEICEYLEASGLKCWIGPRDVLPGSDWGEAIIDAISHSRLMVLVYSENANRSTQVKREVERAAGKGVPIIPFRIEDVPTSKSLEYHLSTAHWLDALSYPLEPHLRYLSEIARKMTGASTTNMRARRPGTCAGCGAALTHEANKCEACGRVREIPSADEGPLPVVTGRRRVRRRWPFGLRSRAAKLVLLAAFVAAAVAAGLYFATRKSGVEASINSAGAHLSNGEFDQAIDELTQTITEDPSRETVYRFRGSAYLQRATWWNRPDDLTRAVADLSRAVKFDPHDSFAYSTLGQTYFRMGDMRKAREAFDNALRDAPRDYTSLKFRGYILLTTKEYDRAIEDFTNALEIFPKDMEVLMKRGDAYLEKGEYASALADYNTVHDMSPSHPAPYKGMSEVKRRQGRLEEAIELDRQANKLASSQPQATPSK